LLFAMVVACFVNLSFFIWFYERHRDGG